MSYAQQRSPGRQAVGFTVVVVLHVVLGYVMITGLGKQIVEVIKQPLETKIIEEVKPPEPPPPPPPPPPQSAPPPVFIPPVEIIINTPPPPPPVQAAVTIAPPVQAVVRPTPPPAPPAAIPDRNVSERPISGSPPKYPKRMMEAQREGSVDIECDVDIEGKTSNCAIITITGGGSFGDAAMEYVMQARYAPKIEHGVPVATRHRWTIKFTLG
jgi:protein TonB